MPDDLRPDVQLCLRVADEVLAPERGTTGVRVERFPERDLRDEPAVEIVVSDDKGEIALEHTTIEPFDGNIQANATATRLFGPNPVEVDGLDPGSTYQLSVRPDELNALGRTWPVAGEKVLQWVSEIAPTLASSDLPPQDRVRRSAPDELPLQVTLLRGPSIDGSPLSGRLLVTFEAPPDREQRRQARLLRALKTKVPKLMAEGRNGASTALVFETFDISLTNDDLVINALAETATEYAGTLPDYIVLVVTVGDGVRLVWVLYSHGSWHPRATFVRLRA